MVTPLSAERVQVGFNICESVDANTLLITSAVRQCFSHMAGNLSPQDTILPLPAICLPSGPGYRGRDGPQALLVLPGRTAGAAGTVWQGF